MRTKNAKFGQVRLLLAGFILLHQIAKGQTTDSVLSLRACVELSYANNDKLRQAQLETDKIRYQYQEALSAGLPQVSGTAALEKYFDIPVTMVSGDIFGQPGTTLPIQLGTKNIANAGIQAGQMIYNASYFASLRLFKKACKISELTLEKSQEEVAYSVSQMYFFIQNTNLQLTLLDSNLVALRKVYDYSNQHYINGFIRSVDLDRITVTINTMESESEKLLSVRNQQLNMLKYLIGIDQNQPIMLSANKEIDMVPAILEDSTFAGHPDMLLLSQQMELAKLNLKLTRSEILPSFTGYAVLSYQAQREQFDLFDDNHHWYRTSFAGIKLSVPIFEGGRVKSKANKNKVELEQVMVAQRDLQYELYLNCLNALQRLSTSKTVAQKLNENMVLAEKIFRVTSDQYRQGLKSLTDVLTIQSEYHVARLSWVQTLLEIKISELELIKINGGFHSYFL